MADSGSFDIRRFPVHLGLGAAAFPCEEFDGSVEWYGRYGEAVAADGYEGRLVAMHSFEESWDVWEMHPNGHELVLCVAGEITLHQEIDGAPRSMTLRVGEAVINAPGVWHTADVAESATVVFVTAGVGTEHRPR